jgi:YggT family protein
MFVLANLLSALAQIIDIAVFLYILAIFAVVVVSWFAPRSMHPIVLFLRRITEPLLGRLRRRFPILVQGGFDLSPIIAFFALYFVQKFLVRTLYQLAERAQ